MCTVGWGVVLQFMYSAPWPDQDNEDIYHCRHWLFLCVGKTDRPFRELSSTTPLMVKHSYFTTLELRVLPFLLSYTPVGLEFPSDLESSHLNKEWYLTCKARLLSSSGGGGGDRLVLRWNSPIHNLSSVIFHSFCLRLSVRDLPVAFDLWAQL